MLSRESVGKGLELAPPVVREVADLATAIERLARQTPAASDQAEQANKHAEEVLLAEAVNETTNRLNGIINYAQLLYDSSEQHSLSEEQKAMVRKIIDGGGRIAGQWQKLK